MAFLRRHCGRLFPAALIAAVLLCVWYPSRLFFSPDRPPSSFLSSSLFGYDHDIGGEGGDGAHSSLLLAHTTMAPAAAAKTMPALGGGALLVAGGRQGGAEAGGSLEGSGGKAVVGEQDQLFPDPGSPVFQDAHDDDKALQPSDWAAQRTFHQRVVAVADVHGDLPHTLNVLRLAGLVDRTGNWCGGKDVLVNTGDIVDRGDDTIALYEMFERLRIEAEAVGGKVVQILGNHEYMNALGDWRYVTPGDIASFGGIQPRVQAITPSGWIGRNWLQNYTLTANVPLLPTEGLPTTGSGYVPPSVNFVHGGMPPWWAGMGIETLNELGKSLMFKALKRQEEEGLVNPGAPLPSDTTDLEKALYSEDGPLWFRGYAYETDRHKVCGWANLAKKRLGQGVRHLVMGHTPHPTGFIVRCDASILLIDTGISRVYGGEQSALIFETSLEPPGPPDVDRRGGRKESESGLWKETEIITAMYKGRRPTVIKKLQRLVDLDVK